MNPLFNSKIRFYEILSHQLQSAVQSSTHQTFDQINRIQLVGLSATMGNVKQLAEWMGAQLFCTDFRPVPLTEHIVAGNQLMLLAGTDRHVSHERTLPPTPANIDPDKVVSLTTRSLQQGQQVLVFCATKAACSQTCKLLCDNMHTFLLNKGIESQPARSKRKCVDISSPSPQLVSHIAFESQHSAMTSQQLLAAREDLVRSLQGLDKVPSSAGSEALESLLVTAVRCGVGYHHAGLDPGERILIEAAFSSGVISVLTGHTCSLILN